MIYTNVKDVVAQDFDAILILGGGLPSSLYEPPVYVKQRCDDAAAIRGDSETPILTLSAGTAHLPQLLSKGGLPVWESTSSAAYLSKKHHIQSNVYLETTSYDTIGNAFFARTSHTDIVKWITTNVVNALVSWNPLCSSLCTFKNYMSFLKFHMDRTKIIFDWIFGIDIDRDNPYQLAYFASPDVGLSEDALRARCDHETRSAKTICTKLVPKYTTMKEVWMFLNQNHDLYTASKLIGGVAQDGLDSRNDALKASYGAN